VCWYLFETHPPPPSPLLPPSLPLPPPPPQPPPPPLTYTLVTQSELPYEANFDSDYPDGCWRCDPTYEMCWTQSDGAGTPSPNTGPDSAHSGSQFMYMEASDPAKQEDRASMVCFVDLRAPTNPPMLEFYYHMYGASIGSLIVSHRTLIDDPSTNGISASSSWGDWETDWQKSGEQHTASTSSWTKAQIVLPLEVVQININGIRGGWQSDMAIDSIRIDIQDSSPPPPPLPAPPPQPPLPPSP